MKFTVALLTLLCISKTWAIKTKNDDPKDKRDAAGDYAISGHSSRSYQAPAIGHEDANSISIGAGYSVGGQKPSYGYVGQGPTGPYQLQSASHQGSGHQTIQLSPITLQAGQEGLVSNDLSQLMSQLSQGINSGAIPLPSGGQEVAYQFDNQGHSGQLAIPQYSFGAPKFSQYSLGEQGRQTIPAYAIGTKGLSTYSATGPVLFSPGSQPNQQSLSYGGTSSGPVYESNGLAVGDSGHSFSGLAFSGNAPSLGGPYKAIRGNYATSSKASFKPSTFLGASIPSESSHSLSGVSGSYTPSFANYQPQHGSFGGLSLGSIGHGGNFGSLSGYGSSSKLIAPSKGDDLGSLESIASSFSAGGQMVSPPGTTYGVPATSYPSNNLHAASLSSPQYYVSPSKYSSSNFGSGSSSYKGPVTSHGSFNSYSSGPKYSFGGHSSSYSSPKDTQGAYSESIYNTIKYSEELKPRVH